MIIKIPVTITNTRRNQLIKQAYNLAQQILNFRGIHFIKRPVVMTYVLFVDSLFHQSFESIGIITKIIGFPLP